MLSDLLIISGLILLNGFFALSELAVLSAKPTRLRMLANAGRAGAGTALKLAEDPSRFLSSVQIGITLVGIFAGAYGGATLSAPLAERLATVPLLASHADTLAFGGVVAVLTYLSLIIGELVPKQLALAHAEPLAAFVSRPMRLMAALSAPLVGLLDVSTRLVLKLLGQHAAVRHKVSDEEIHALLAEASEAGVVERSEHEMLHRVMRFADRPVEAIMTPRPDILWLDIDADQHTLLMLLETSRTPACPFAGVSWTRSRASCCCVTCSSSTCAASPSTCKRPCAHRWSCRKACAPSACWKSCGYRPSRSPSWWTNMAAFRGWSPRWTYLRRWPEKPARHSPRTTRWSLAPRMEATCWMAGAAR